MNRLFSAFIAITIITGIYGCANTEEGAAARRGAGYGAAGGAMLGLAMGAASGEKGWAAAGAATGAAAGAATGAMYEYGQAREDNRTKMLADSIGGANQGETVDEAGKRHLEDFIGEWNVAIWSTDTEGKRISGSGKAKVVLTSKTEAKFELSDIKAEGSDTNHSGTATMTYDEASGFTLISSFSASPETLRFTGEYRAEPNKYDFYLNNNEGTTVTGVQRSNVRVEIRVSGSNMWVAETYTFIDGKEQQVQSYRFTK